MDGELFRCTVYVNMAFNFVSRFVSISWKSSVCKPYTFEKWEKIEQRRIFVFGKCLHRKLFSTLFV